MLAGRALIVRLAPTQAIYDMERRAYTPSVSPMNFACTMTPPNVLHTPQQSGVPYDVTEVHRAIASEAQVSVVLMNWERNKNVAMLMAVYSKFNEVGEVVVLLANQDTSDPVQEAAARINSRKIKVREALDALRRKSPSLGHLVTFVEATCPRNATKFCWPLVVLARAQRWHLQSKVPSQFWHIGTRKVVLLEGQLRASDC